LCVCFFFPSIEGMQRGLGLCMKLQRVIVQQGTAMIEKKSVKTLRTFRLAIIKDGPDISLFTHPLTLSKLALFLVDAYRVKQMSQNEICIFLPT